MSDLFYLGAGDLNANPHAYFASTLLTELSPQSLIFFNYHIL